MDLACIGRVESANTGLRFPLLCVSLSAFLPSHLWQSDVCPGAVAIYAQGASFPWGRRRKRGLPGRNCETGPGAAEISAPAGTPRRYSRRVPRHRVGWAAVARAHRLLGQAWSGSPRRSCRKEQGRRHMRIPASSVCARQPDSCQREKQPKHGSRAADRKIRGPGNRGLTEGPGPVTIRRNLPPGRQAFAAHR